MPAWATILIAISAGALGVFAFAPFYVWPVAIVSLGGLFALLQGAETQKRAALIGFSWGMGIFLAGVSWLYVALHVYGEMPAPMAAIAIFLFCCYLSCFPMLAAIVAFKLQKKEQPLVALLLVMPVCLVAAEYLRAWFLTGFPWLVIGYSQTPGGLVAAPLAGYAPVLGVFGISWLLAVTAGAAVLLIKPLMGIALPKRSALILISAIALVWGAGLFMQQMQWSTPSGAPLSVALAQGNIDQDLKWRDDQRDATRAQYFQLIKDSQAKLIVLPETADTTFLDDIPPDYLAALKMRAEKNNGDLIMGALVATRDADGQSILQYANSAVSMGVSPPQRYDKHHLVAFGEFVPPLFSWAYKWLNIPLTGFTAGPKKPVSMRVSGHFIAVNICYEDTFGDEIALPSPEPALLVNIANMAWYGRSLAAEQHAQFSQMRAMETSRWMLRATNTGLTAAINERGEVVKSLKQFTRGVLEVAAIPRQGVTPYVRWRDQPVLVGLAIALTVAFFIRRRALKPTKPRTEPTTK